MPDQYFQGILQLRGVNEKMVDFVLSQFEKKNVGIAKVNKLKNGIDIYSASNKFSRNIGRKIQKMWGGEIKESPRLFTHDHLTSKDVYRLNVLYRAFPVKIGDIIVRDGSVYRISGFDKSLMILVNLSTKKKRRLKYDNERVLDSVESEVIQVKPNVCVLDEDYQAIVVGNAGKVKVGDKIKIVVVNGNAYEV